MFINENNLKELPQSDVIPPSLELDSAAFVRGDNFIMEYWSDFITDNFIGEYWSILNGFNEHYEGSTFGRFRCWYEYDSHGVERKLTKPRIICQHKTNQGYINVQLRLKKGKSWVYRSHRLLASIFHPNPDNYPQVNHINGIKHDNRKINIEWCSGSQNMRHAWDNNLITVGRAGMVKNSKLTFEQVKEVYYSTLTYKSLQVRYGISRMAVQRIKMATHWNFLIGNTPNGKNKRRLPKDVVLDIYNSGDKTKVLHSRHGVSYYTIQRIKKGCFYSHITKAI